MIKMEEIKTPKTLKQDPSMKKQEYKRGDKQEGRNLLRPLKRKV